jgi:hypothetical protein
MGRPQAGSERLRLDQCRWALDACGRGVEAVRPGAGRLQIGRIRQPEARLEADVAAALGVVDGAEHR